MRRYCYFSLLLFLACNSPVEKDPDYADPVVNTLPALNPTTNTVTLQGSFTNPDHAPIVTVGFVWGTDTLPSIDKDKVKYPKDNKASIITGDLTGLTSKSVYHYRTYVTISKGTIYGQDVRFVTK